MSNNSKNVYRNDKGEIGVLYGYSETLFALVYRKDEINHTYSLEYGEWIFDPELIKMVLQNKQNNKTGKEHDWKFVGDPILRTELKAKWNKYITEKYPNYGKGNYENKFASINDVSVGFVKEGSPFVIVNRNDFDHHTYGEELIKDNIVIA